MPTPKLSPEFVEHIHDVLVGLFLPYDERVSSAERRDRSAIESALGRPYQTVGGEDAYERVIRHAKRVVKFAVTSLESFRKEKFPNRDELDQFMSQYP
jgi:hypothetical protein